MTLAQTRARAILEGLGIRPQSASVAILVAWQAAEGVDAYANNPLATENPNGANGLYNAAGVRTYPTEAAGVAATVQTLGAYPGIVAALRAASPTKFLAQTAELQTWCGCDEAQYAANIASRIGVPYTPPGGTGPSSSTVVSAAKAAKKIPPWVGWIALGAPAGALIIDAIERGRGH